MKRVLLMLSLLFVFGQLSFACDKHHKKTACINEEDKKCTASACDDTAEKGTCECTHSKEAVKKDVTTKEKTSNEPEVKDTKEVKK